MQDSLNLKHLMNNDEYVDNTRKIRELKHSEDILLDVGKICQIKNDAQYKTKSKDELEELRTQCSAEANFLFTHYTDIFHKVFNDELDLQLLVEFVKILKRIEENDLDQYNGSVLVGKILHDMYISSAQARSRKLDADIAAASAAEATSIAPASALVAPPYDTSLSWKSFKHHPPASETSSTPHNRHLDDGEVFCRYGDFKYHRLQL